MVVAGLLVLVGGPSPAAQAPSFLFSEAPAERPSNLAVERVGTRRWRAVRVNPAAIDALLRSGTADRPAVALNLFPDVQLAIAREYVEQGRQGHGSWVGHVEGDPESTVALTWDGRVLSGGVVTRGRAFELIPAADGVVVVAERDASASPPLELVSPDAPDGGTVDASAQALAADGVHAAIDLLVLYTPAARAVVGGARQIQSQLANAVAVTNAAFQRSGVHAALTATAIQEFAYTEGSGIGEDLTAISVGGAFNTAVESLRVAAGADLVALVTGRATAASGCGVAWLGPSNAYALSVTEQACLYAGQWS